MPRRSIPKQFPILTGCCIIILSIIVASCATPDYIPNTTTSQNASIIQSVEIAEQSAIGDNVKLVLNNCVLCDNSDYDSETLTALFIEHDGKTVRLTTQGNNVDQHHTCTISAEALSRLGLFYGQHGAYLLDQTQSFASGSSPFNCGDGHIEVIDWDSRARAISFINAIAALASAQPGAYAAQLDVANNKFKSIAVQYRMEQIKPALPTDAQRYATQANDAFSNHRVSDAILLYDKALDTSPWWPTGHYNLALLLGSKREYADAIDEMNKYLELVPDAPDAQKAKQHIWVWQGREQDDQGPTQP
jgi:tetratricopeptide (TPR) repeat protein